MEKMTRVHEATKTQIHTALMLACRHMRARAHAHTHILIKASDEIKASSNGMCKCIFCDTLCFCKPVEKFKDFNTSFLLADGEIINQIKMTNLALADIKELLKQQVSIIFGGLSSREDESTFKSAE